MVTLKEEATAESVRLRATRYTTRPPDNASRKEEAAD
jgi:hypothetical protein